MAKYRAISLNFWTDAKIADDFTPEDRYFYLYLFTNPHTNLCGCYEISIKQMVNETGYSKDTIERLLERFRTIHKVTDYSSKSKEILLINWHKYNWTSSEKFRKPLAEEIKCIKNEFFKDYLTKIFNGEDEGYGIDTPCIDTTVSVSVSDSVSDKYINLITLSINEHNYSSYISNILTDWFLYKREKGNSYKAMGLSRLLNKVDKMLLTYSEEQIGKVIEECMERNYQGIIWDLLEKKENKSSGSAYMDAIKNRVNVVDDWV
jgi:hypothetical protein